MKGSYVKRSSLLGSAAVLSAAALSAAAAALLRRLLRHGAVEQAVRSSSGDASTGELPLVPTGTADAAGSGGARSAGAHPARRGHPPVTPVPPHTVTATAADPADSGDPAGSGDAGQRPARTWIVDNSSDWDGSPLERVVPPAGDPWKGTPGVSPA